MDSQAYDYFIVFPNLSAHSLSGLISLLVTPEGLCTVEVLRILDGLYQKKQMNRLVIDEVSPPMILAVLSSSVLSLVYLDGKGSLHLRMGTRLPCRIPQVRDIQTTFP